jgi:hypothetical protein
LWHEERKLTSSSRTREGPIGTTFSFTLDRPAQVQFRFTQIRSGRRAGKRCVALTKTNRHDPDCSRRLTLATMRFPAHEGMNEVRFSGRTPQRLRLPLGHYILTITASNKIGISQPRTLSFTIVR